MYFKIRHKNEIAFSQEEENTYIASKYKKKSLVQFNISNQEKSNQMGYNIRER